MPKLTLLSTSSAQTGAGRGWKRTGNTPLNSWVWRATWGEMWRFSSDFRVLLNYRQSQFVLNNYNLFAEPGIFFFLSICDLSSQVMVFCGHELWSEVHRNSNNLRKKNCPHKHLKGFLVIFELKTWSFLSTTSISSCKQWIHPYLWSTMHIHAL